MTNFLVLLASTSAALLFSLILMPLIMSLSHRMKWYDIPDKRKIHTGLIPRLGGVGMYISVVVVSILSSALYLLLTGKRGFFQTRYLSILAGFTLVHCVGLFDDFRSLRALPKLSIQIMAGAIIAIGGFTISSISLPYIGTISLGILAYPITILWLVGISNALNLVDGMDGLAGGISAFAALSMGIIALIQQQVLTAMLAFILFGSIVGFLVFNFPPAKIFMGDCGSLFLGFALAIIPLMGISKAASFSTLIIPITLLTIPIIDTFAAIIRRIRAGRSIASPDKDHIHHKLLYMGLNERKILFFLYGFCLYLSIVAITSVVLPRETNVYFILIVWVGSLLGYYFLDFLKEKKKISSNTQIQRKDSSAS
jgi:UDP-GlcNAc:undecaprenyl-phosphate GlcNAc-1-phosphate transferase